MVTFDEFLDAHLTAMARYATALTCDPHLAQDVTQEVMLRAQRKWQRIGALDAPQHYVRRMITNEYLSWRRRRAARDIPLPPGDLVASGPAQTDRSAQYDERDAMLARIAQLPRRQRTALALRYYCDLNDAEIAETMGCRQATVRTHIFRGLNALRAQPAVPGALAGTTNTTSTATPEEV